MSTPHFHHRPAHPDQPDTHATERLVYYGDDPVGGAVLQTTAHIGDKWQWSAMTADGHDASGYADTLEEALAKVKAAALRSMEEWPNLLEEKRALRLKAKAAHNAWRRIHNMPERE